MLRNLSDGAFDVLSKITFDVLDIGTKISQQTVNADLKQQHKLNGVTSYNSNDYERIAFNTHADARNFENELKNRGLECAVSTTKTHGQVFVEISKNVSNLENYSTVYDVIDEIQSNTGILYERPNDTVETINQENPYNEINSSIEGIATSTARNFDEFGEAVSKAISLVADVHRLDKAEKREATENIVSENFVDYSKIVLPKTDENGNTLYKKNSKGEDLLQPSANGILGNNEWNKESYTVINGKIKYRKETSMKAIPITRKQLDRVRRRDECYFRSKRASFIHSTTNAKGEQYKWQGGALDKILTQVNTSIATEHIKKDTDISKGKAPLLNALNNGFKLKLGIYQNLNKKKPQINSLTQNQLLSVNNNFLKKAEAAGFHIVGVTGKLDEKVLNNMTLSDFQKMGIGFKSVEEMNAFKSMTTQLNEKKAFGKIGNERGLLRKSVGKGIGKLTSDNLDSQTQQDIANMQLTAHYSKQVLKSTKRITKATRSVASTAKHGLTVLAPKTSAKVANQMSKLPTPVKNVKKRAKDAFASTKIGKKTYKASNAMHRFNTKAKGVRTKIGKYNPFALAKKGVNKVKETAKKLLVKVVILPVAVVLCGTIAIVVVWSSIGDLFDALKCGIGAAFFQPETLNDTVMMDLYSQLKDQEDMWLIRINDFKNLYDNKDEYRYGIAYTTLAGYTNELNENNAAITPTHAFTDEQLETNKRSQQRFYYDRNNDKLYISPFGKYANLSQNKDLLTEVESYDGQNDVTINSNANRYGIDLLDETEIRSYDNAVSNGHTCNIKDILAMIDVMYEADDDDSILTAGVGEVTWYDWCNNIAGFFKFVVKNVVSVFSTDEFPTLKECINENGTNYDRVQQYAALLFEESHQQDLSFSMKFYTVTDDEVTVKSGNDTVAISDKSEQKEFGYCTDPIKKKFKITYMNGRVSPYINWKDNNGTNHVISLDSGTLYNLKISMSNLIDRDDRCLWDNMSANASTLNKIKDNIGVFGIGACWEKSNDNAEKIYSDFKESGWFESRAECIDDLKNKFRQEWNDFTNKTDSQQEAELKNQANKQHISHSSDSDSLSSSHDKFIDYYYKANHLQNGQVGIGTDLENITRIDSKEVITGWKEQIENDKELLIIADKNFNSNVLSDYYVADPQNNENKRDENGRSPKCLLHNAGTQENINGVTAYYLIKSGTDTYEYNSHNELEKMTYEDISGTKHTVTLSKDVKIVRKTYNYPVPEKKKLYRYKAQQYIGDFCTDTYTRKCKGHKFKYCGGHLCVHSEGNVFSTTNEQISVVDYVENDDIKPVVNEENWLKSNGYKNLIGKYNSKKLGEKKKRYNTFEAYIQSGSVGYGTPRTLTQGSSVAFNYPINLKSDLGTSVGVCLWDSDFGCANPNDDGSYDTDEMQSQKLNINNFRDIFDVDCYITKGYDVFPRTTSADWKDYEGWTTDTMEQAITKISGDWYGLYGFDIPIEISNKFQGAKSLVAPSTDEDSSKEDDNNGTAGGIVNAAEEALNEATGTDNSNKDSKKEKPKPQAATKTQAGYTLSDDDINNICEAVGVKKGTKRYNVVKLALEWVGRGHYSEYHSSHDFLSAEHKGLVARGSSVRHDGCCTAGDSTQFINFILEKAGVKNLFSNDNLPLYYNGKLQVSNIKKAISLNSAKSGDVFIHKPIKSSDFNLKGAKWNDEAKTVFKRYKGTQAVIYIGTLKEDLLISSGQTLHKDTPIVVDLNEVNLNLSEENDWQYYAFNGTLHFNEMQTKVPVGNVYLHGKSASSVVDYTGESTYYWITHPDTKSYWLSIGD